MSIKNIVGIITSCILSLCSFNANCKTNNTEPEIDSITGLIVYNYYELDELPAYITENDSIVFSPERSQIQFMFEVINSVDYKDISRDDMIPRLDIEFIITKNGELCGERFVGKDNSELNTFQRAIINSMKGRNKWLPGRINGQKVNTKLRMATHVKPNY